MTDTPPVAPPVTPPATGNWFDGITGDDLAYIQNRGLDKMDQKTAFMNTMKGHREAEAKLGIPSQLVFRLPKDAADAEGWTRFDNQFNVPADGKYDFSSVKFADGSAVEDQELIGALSTALKSNHVSKDAAGPVLKAIVDYMDKSETGEGVERQAKIDAERMELKATWGARFTPNMLIAQNVAKTLGLTPEFINNVEKDIGYVKTMDTLIQLAQALGEDQFIPTTATGDVAYSPDQAQQLLDEKQRDPAWVKKLNDGDSTVVREFHNLTQLIAEKMKNRR